ncbi:hypothetical protein IEN85_08240 [Pelagicoccus sp. NFK12]|uniref:Uncharacterized protein n=1 Tax=Pelagicoccus enzymogenes TaxID=2773457 RepID=A0A927F922_9BACT|nr:hypothetical protein [Pelagicoccus enzymogenes]MBD5779481.1 hypothetical protein [Pelagicoccus enzymogenes]
MKTEKLEITGIRLIGFYFLFSTAYHVSTAFLTTYYNAQDPEYESVIAAFANAATITQTILSVVVLLLSIVAMFRPRAIQRRWRKIDQKESEEDEFEIGSLTLFRMAALMMALYFAQKSLSEVVYIALVTNVSFSGMNMAQAISHTVFLVMSLYLFIKPEVITKWK